MYEYANDINKLLSENIWYLMHQESFKEIVSKRVWIQVGYGCLSSLAILKLKDHFEPITRTNLLYKFCFLKHYLPYILYVEAAP